jgi:hypothetical protein
MVRIPRQGGWGDGVKRKEGGPGERGGGRGGPWEEGETGAENLQPQYVPCKFSAPVSPPICSAAPKKIWSAVFLATGCQNTYYIGWCVVLAGCPILRARCWRSKYRHYSIGKVFELRKVVRWRSSKAN